MSLEMELSIHQEQTITMTMMFGETIGDIPMYSLHRIKSRLHMALRTTGISNEMLNMFLACLLKANEIYKEESGNDWSCLTSNNLVWAFERLDRMLKVSINRIRKGQPREMHQTVNQIISSLHERRKDDMQKLKQWFSDGAEFLHYNMSANVPWAVVRSLRKKLSLWIAENVNPFGEDIEDAIINIAAENGFHSSDAKDAWEKMGGKVFSR